MIAKNVRKAGLIALLVAVVATVVPQAAFAVDPPAFNSTVVFGNAKPGDANFGDGVFGGAHIYPMSLPYGANFERGLLYVEGNVLPGAGSAATSLFVDVKVTDVGPAPSPPKVSRTVTTADVADPNGTVPGDFNAELRITDLGVHQVTDPLGTPTQKGESTLYVTLTARDVSAGLETTTGPLTITKHAGVPTGCTATQLCPADTTAPTLTRFVWPPSNWCHTSGAGFLGGNGQGNCGLLSPAPDLTWVTCWGANSGFSLCPAGQNSRSAVPHGFAQVVGEAIDDTGSARGVASEIYRIRIQMTQNNVVLKEYSNILRSGPKANWGYNMPINDFESNYPMGPAYVVKVIVEDAYGKMSTANSPNITIYPW